jgi:flagellar protein FlgJ
MSIAINGASPFLNGAVNQTSSTTKTKELEHALSSVSESTDEELMSVCKNFESYFVEQVFKEMKKTVSSSEDENEYMQYFGDMLTGKYAESSTEGDGIGIAKMLYESMKRN